MSSKHYQKLTLIRVISCIAVLLYHINILKSGYLAVCTFFVLTGYLAVISSFKKDKFSLKRYYLNKLEHVYLPLLLVVFITIAVIKFIPSINFLNLKPETTSVIFGYNNFWQLKANLDYFARHVDSPFMHFWYIAILLQFELVFPFLFLLLRKIGNKFGKIVPSIISLLITIGFSVYFYIVSLDNDVMFLYYNTLTRLFSLCLGMTVGFIHTYYHAPVFKKIQNSNMSVVIFYLYLLLIITSFFIDGKINILMLIVTFISARLIDYATVSKESKKTFMDKVIKFIAKNSYEIYLVQYPVIFLLQDIMMNQYLKLGLMVIITVLISYILHFAISFKDKKHKILKIVLTSILGLIALFGLYNYVIAKDYTPELRALEAQLDKNSEDMQLKQQEYLARLKENESKWEEELKNLEPQPDELSNMIHNLQVVGIGDSVMLGAINNLYGTFPNGYFDAEVSRTAWVLNGILINLKNNGLLGNPIILNLGVNGDCSLECKQTIMNTLGDRKVFWINSPHNNYINNSLSSFANNYPNIYIVDWNSVSAGHDEYFVIDGIHLTMAGREAYAKMIFDSIYNNYLEELNKKKEEAINKHDDELKKKITFYGNDILLNAFSSLELVYPDANYKLDNYTYDSLIDAINDDIINNTLNYRVVLAFDSQLNLNRKEINNITKLCKGHDIYMIFMDEHDNYEGVKQIDFYKEVREHPEYVMVDRIHLSDMGNSSLIEYLVDNLKID